jgi:hypothetical protein
LNDSDCTLFKSTNCDKNLWKIKFTKINSRFLNDAISCNIELSFQHESQTNANEMLNRKRLNSISFRYLRTISFQRKKILIHLSLTKRTTMKKTRMIRIKHALLFYLAVRTFCRVESKHELIQNRNRDFKSFKHHVHEMLHFLDVNYSSWWR